MARLWSFAAMTRPFSTYFASIIIGLAVGLSLFAAAAPSYAQNNDLGDTTNIDIPSIERVEIEGEEGTWNLSENFFTPTGLGFKAAYRDKPIKVEILYADRDGSMGNVAFVCAERNLTLRVSVDDVDIRDQITENLLGRYKTRGNPRRIFRPVVYANAERQDRVKWLEGPDDRLIMPIDRKTVRRFYNHVVRGDSVRIVRDKMLDIDGKNFDLDLFLPPMNDSFKDFGAECGIGRLAER